MSQFDDPSGAMPQPGPEGEMHGPDAGPAEAYAPLPTSPAPFEAQEPDEKLDRKVIVYWLLSGFVSWLFIALFMGGGTILVWLKWTSAFPFVVTGVGILLGLLLVWTLISPTLAYNRWRFRVDEELLLARYGILFIEEKAIPISRLQHVDLYRGLLERFFGLTTLIVFTAGTEGAHFRLPGLAVERARQLRDLILAARGDDVI